MPRLRQALRQRPRQKQKGHQPEQPALSSPVRAVRPARPVRPVRAVRPVVQTVRPQPIPSGMPLPAPGGTALPELCRTRTRQAQQSPLLQLPLLPWQGTGQGIQRPLQRPQLRPQQRPRQRPRACSQSERLLPRSLLTQSLLTGQKPQGPGLPLRRTLPGTRHSTRLKPRPRHRHSPSLSPLLSPTGR